MKIAFAMCNFLGRHGGAEIHLRRLADELIVLGHECTVFAAEPDAAQEQAGASTGFPVVQLARDRDRERRERNALRWTNMPMLETIALRILPGGYTSLKVRGACCPQLADPSLFEPFDTVVHFHSSASNWLFQLDPVIRRRHRKTVAVPLFHTREIGHALPMQRRWHASYDAIMTNTAFEADFLRSHGWRQRVIAPVGVGSDAPGRPPDPGAFRSKFNVPDQAPIVLFIGRKIFNKGIAHLIQAMDEVWDCHPQARLVLLGFSHNAPGWLDDYFARSRHDARRLTINIDDVDDPTRENALAACTVFAMPSISDSFGIAYLDAWRHRKPVIGCTETCAESVIDRDRDGLLVPFGAIPDLSRAMVRLLGEPALARAMGEAGYRKWESTYTWPAAARRAEAFLQEVMRS
jgi:glycosyltransferase involved in cell wall biosynthesis